MNKLNSQKGVARWLGLAVLAVVLAACSPVMRYHGYAPSPEQLSAVEVGQDTRDTVAEKIGRPGIGGVMEGSGWFYVQSDWRQRSWRAPEEVDRQVVAISFDQRDRVSNIERFGLEAGEVVTLSRRVTTLGPTPTVLSQVLRVLGQFTPGAFL
ncbi:outer membrane protein assembly factor BamE [Pararhodobacter oceanensis]|uniref:Outer membrane protein assembly factor BamE n=1 Tax=Pararhodobacter oceanensis TaxID=2172121 RepID=A0A2T8HTD4_9RHOB|nr:outer membrane protein assembly factor BamE [Pararhodobacter oceanensis]PVH28714.1 outer membrane protein assembly factor BamE [Pararhodobacter oceanensis]